MLKISRSYIAPFLLLIGSLFSSCSTLKKDETNQKEISTPIKTIKEAEGQMKELIQAAKKSGPEAIRYLASDLFLKANDASIREDVQTAAFLFKALVDLIPEDDYLKKKYASELVRLGEFEESVKILEFLFYQSQFKGDESLGLILAGVYSALDKGQKMKEIYLQILKNDPKSEEACILLAREYAEEKRHQKAHSLLKKCSSKNLASPIIPYFRGKLLLDEGKKEQALRFFKLSQKKDSEYYQAVLAEGLIYEEEEKYDQAIKTYKNYLKENSSNLIILNAITRLLFIQEKYEVILPYLEELVTLDPKNINLKLRLGVLYSEMGNNVLAKGVFKEILVSYPKSDRVIFYLGALEQEEGNWETSLEYFGKIDVESSLFHESQVQIAQILQMMVQSSSQDTKKSLEKRFFKFIDNALQQASNLKIPFVIMKASYLEEKGLEKEALKVLDDFQDKKLFSEIHLYYWASLLDKNGEHQKAESLVKGILEKNPENAHALNFLGYSLLERGENLPLAFKYISKAVQLAPEDGYIRDSLGWYYYKTGQYEKALTEISLAYKSVKSDSVILKHLAAIYQKLKKFDHSLRFYNEALKQCKSVLERKKIIQEIESLNPLRLPASSSKK